MISIKQINKFLLYETPDTTATLGLVLGARSVSGYIAQETLRLYREKKINKIAISGGNSLYDILPLRFYFKLANDGFGDILKHPLKKEANYIQDFLIANKVNKTDIILLENQSKNTGENIKNSLEILQQYKSTLIIAVAYGHRRALSTYRRFISDKNYHVTTKSVYPLGLNNNNWHQNRSIKKLVINEFQKINPKNKSKTSYIEQGFCVHTSPQKEHLAMQKKQRLKSEPQPKVF